MAPEARCVYVWPGTLQPMWYSLWWLFLSSVCVFSLGSVSALPQHFLLLISASLSVTLLSLSHSVWL